MFTTPEVQAASASARRLNTAMPGMSVSVERSAAPAVPSSKVAPKILPCAYHQAIAPRQPLSAHTCLQPTWLSQHQTACRVKEA